MLGAKHVSTFLLFMNAVGENEEQLWDKKEQPEVESRRLQMRRGRRDLWGNWGQASTTEDDQKGLVWRGTFQILVKRNII